MTSSGSFIDRHEIWTNEQKNAACQLARTIDTLDSVRVIVCDMHGLPRSRVLTPLAFLPALKNGVRFSSAHFVLDSGSTVVSELLGKEAPFGVAEMWGAGSFIAVPDPLSFRVLPHTNRPCGWVLAQEYLQNGTVHPLSGRAMLRSLTERLAATGRVYRVGLELEWYLTRYNRQTIVETSTSGKRHDWHWRIQPIDNGNQLNLDGMTDALSFILDDIASALHAVDLPLLTVEHESGPGQIELTFAPLDGMQAADAALLIRSLTKQICQRRGLQASFMALPAGDKFKPSGWHLHQSLNARADGQNLFASKDADELLSPLGRSFLAGLLHHAVASCALATPTVNGYRRFASKYRFAPCRVDWGHESRGALVRVVGQADDPSVHLETRLGEPCASPYLYLASQLGAGMDGIDQAISLDVSSATAPQVLPDNLDAAVALLTGSPFFQQLLGGPLMECFAALKRSEAGRFATHRSADNERLLVGEVTEWEMAEYFEHF